MRRNGSPERSGVGVRKPGQPSEASTIKCILLLLLSPLTARKQPDPCPGSAEMAGGLPLRPTARSTEPTPGPSKRVVYECAGCGRQVPVIAGTIFEQSQKPLVRWFRALFEITASKQGIAAAELQCASSGSAAIKRHGPGSPNSAPPWFDPIGSPCPARSRSPRATSGGPEPGKPGRAAEDKAIVAAAVESVARAAAGFASV